MVSVIAYKFLSLSVVLLNLWLAIWVFLSNRKSKVNLFFSLMAITTCFWISFYYLAITAPTSNSALWWSKLAYASVSLFYIPFYFFFVCFLGLYNKLFYLNKFILFVSIFFFFISIFTNWIVKDAVITKHGIDLILSKGSIGFYGMAIFLSLFVITVLVKKYFTFPSFKKIQIQYFLVGALIWIFMNFIFNMILPLLRGSVQYAEFGNYSIIFFLSFTAYAIVKHHLFGIKVVLTSVFVGLIAILLFINFIGSKTIFEYFWKGTILITFLIFGYLLVKSVINESKRREQLEKLTRQLRKMNIELKKLDKAKSEFLSIASHQLRTPLSIMKGHLSMMLEGSYGKISPKIKNIA
ncbi:MAG: hypothetical protein LR000_02760, partial [Candidatus Pacebacteria bacterium]|nr:hypothetical protein [Candidatus Paceibacterota bacterium]